MTGIAEWRPSPPPTEHGEYVILDHGIADLFITPSGATACWTTAETAIDYLKARDLWEQRRPDGTYRFQIAKRVPRE